jgi:hypothetical protein
MNLVIPKGAARHEFLLNNMATNLTAISRGGFVEHLSPTLVAQQSVTKIIFVTMMNLVTHKAGAKHELLFNKPASNLTGISRGGFVEHLSLT